MMRGSERGWMITEEGKVASLTTEFFTDEKPRPPALGTEATLA